jgi:ubiquinone/menaquinone biosynthesis C-methylase UbiE
MQQATAAIRRARQVLQGARQRLATPMPRSGQPELLDEAVEDRAELAGNFRDIRRVNLLLGGTSIVLRLLPRLLETVPAGQPVSVLDIATGCGDIPVALSRWAVRRGIAMHIVASDISEDILDLAREFTSGVPNIDIVRHDARDVPLPDNSVDIVVCSLALHHFAPPDAIRILREMDRLARHGFILNDLHRSRPGYFAAWLAAHFTTRNRLTRHDAPLSVRRAYTVPELRDLLRRAGIDDAVITRHMWFRMAALRRGASDA